MEIQLLNQPLRGGADVDKNNSGEIKPNGGKDDSNPSETKPDDGKDDSNPSETKPDPIKAALEEGVTYVNVDKLMIAVPGKEFSILATEVTQELYESVMGENPSNFKGEKNLPVEQVSWYDAIVFCNELSKKCGLTPVYAVDGETEAKEWRYDSENKIIGTINQNENANGYRLPTVEEWRYAAKGGQDFKYSGSDNIDEVGWYSENSEDKTHPVAQKDPNGYGLYDMSGNVWEWSWVSNPGSCYNCGGSWYSNAMDCEIIVGETWNHPYSTLSGLGFRIVRSTGK
ncbi:MAG: formylglycine-generating enzyme family protein [Spirochaetales bacterium]|nr:formylglycine-generating enzyme family protein [Spirochaetales bacterium]